MVLTLANALHLPLTVFTSVSNMPVICVIPTTTPLLSTHPICLTFTHDSDQQPGHYDYVVQLDNVQPTICMQTVTKTKRKCTCGRKPGSTAEPCTTFRCPCFRESLECTQSCVCKNCMNFEFGQRPASSSTRRRGSYDEQKHLLKRKSTTQFMKDMGEQSRTGKLTALEISLIKTIVIYCIL